MRQDFIQYITHEKRYSRHTITSYDTDLKQFQDFILSQFGVINLKNADHYIVRSWLVDLLEKKNSTLTINRKISCLKSFYKYLLRDGHVSSNPMLKVIAPKTGKKVPEFVKEKDMEMLLQNIDFGNDFEGIRNKLIIETFYTTGIRVSELNNIKITDVNLEAETIKIHGKRDKERLIPISGYLAESIKKFITIRDSIFNKSEESKPYLFITSRGKQTYSRLIYRIIYKYISYVSTNSKKSPHTLRHSFATVMLNKGAELNAIKELLGHSNLSATQVYTHNSIEKLKTIYKQAHPRA
ncbi:MAG: tyrosine-type recombinase/integrase [Bacteroidales bacterium]|nr:tyrosine-type recombinase/integrase [Bacteroidales bacterium]